MSAGCTRKALAGRSLPFQARRSANSLGPVPRAPSLNPALEGAADDEASHGLDHRRAESARLRHDAAHHDNVFGAAFRISDLHGRSASLSCVLDTLPPMSAETAALLRILKPAIRTSRQPRCVA